MNPRDAEKLLGGYAAGILSDTEKTALFSAALMHQELFDALADEEALRELLADPEARKHLLALLGDSMARRPVTLWRRPAMLGLAASLFAMVTTSLVLWQREKPAPSAHVADQMAEPKPDSTKPSAAETSGEKKLARRTSREEVSARAPFKGDAAQAAPVPAPLAQQAENLALAHPEVRKAETALEPSVEKKQRVADRPQPAVAEGLAAGAPAAKMEGSPQDSATTNRLERLAASRAKAGSGTSVPPPGHALERLDNGKTRLTVIWIPGSHLYVLRRSPSGVQLLAPLRTSPGLIAGRTVSTFEFLAVPQDRVDLYLLPQPAPDPKGLPEEGPMAGYRKRVF